MSESSSRKSRNRKTKHYISYQRKRIFFSKNHRGEKLSIIYPFIVLMRKFSSQNSQKKKEEEQFVCIPITSKSILCVSVCDELSIYIQIAKNKSERTENCLMTWPGERCVNNVLIVSQTTILTSLIFPWSEKFPRFYQQTLSKSGRKSVFTRLIIGTIDETFSV